MRYLRAGLLFSMALILLPLLSILGSGEVVEKPRAFINIEQYESNTIEFDSGDKITISLKLTSFAYPVSVLLIKGDDDYNEFKTSDVVDVEAIKNGEEVDYDNVSYRVVGGFSERNITTYDNSLSLAEHDTYYVLIILYRNANMSYDEILTSRATTVDYRLEYKTENKEVPYYLIPIAIFLLVAGLGLIGYYFWPREEEGEDDIDEDDGRVRTGIHKPVRPPEGRVDRRAPPLRPH